MILTSLLQLVFDNFRRSLLSFSQDSGSNKLPKRIWECALIHEIRVREVSVG